MKHYQAQTSLEDLHMWTVVIRQARGQAEFKKGVRVPESRGGLLSVQGKKNTSGKVGAPRLRAKA